MPESQQLLELYRSYEMPEAPADAPLVQYRTGSGWTNGVERKLYALGFLSREWIAKPDEQMAYEILVGTEPSKGWAHAFEDFKVIAPGDVNVDDLSRPSFATAMQCYGRGWTDLGDRLLQQALEEDDSNRSWTRPNEVQKKPTAREKLIGSIWAYQNSELCKADSDRAKLSKRMHRLLNEEKWFADDSKIALVKSLDASIEPGKGAPGSIEATFDKLVDFRTGDHRDAYDDPNYTQLAMLGFEAIPALIEHLNDDRLTRSDGIGYSGFDRGGDSTPPLLRIADVASHLLGELSGGELKPVWSKERKTRRIDQQAAREWFAKVKEQSEIEFALNHLVKRDPNTNQNVNPAWTRIIQVRYPDRLAEAVRRVINDPTQKSVWPIFELLLASDMSLESKMELLDQAVSSGDFDAKWAALHWMKTLDPERTTSKLIEVLDQFPTTLTSKESFFIPEADFISNASQWEDERVWTAIKKVISRADTPLKVEIFKPWGTMCMANTRQLALLIEYLDDTSIYKSKPAGDMPNFNAIGFEQITVGNFAALTIEGYLAWYDENGRHLQSPSRSFHGSDNDDPRKKWTVEEWKAFRDQMKARASAWDKSHTH